MRAISDITQKLYKLDALESMMTSLNGELTSLQSTVGEVSSSVSSLKSDLKKFNEQWEASASALSERLSETEGAVSTLGKKWEQYQTDASKNLSVVQESVDSNSKQILALETDSATKFSKVQESLDFNSKQLEELKINSNTFKEKWAKIDTVENRVKSVAEDKFALLKSALKDDLTEILSMRVTAIQKMASNSISEGLNKLKSEIKKEIVEDLSASNHTQTDPKVVASTTSAVTSSVNSKQPNLSRLKQQAFAKRHNLIFFGLPEGASANDDLSTVQSFLEERMGLYGVNIATTYRLGSASKPDNRSNARPLVVRFRHIQDRWAVWNGRGNILFVQGSPVWLHEDLPKQLREGNRILQRIAKTARLYPNKFKEVKMRDYKLTIDSTTVTADSTHLLPHELQPSQVYTPRSKEAVIFFTKSSPFSNHFVRPFLLGEDSFTSIEQYLALNRAKLVGNTVLAAKAMKTQDPADHKVILIPNTLYNDHRAEWIAQAPHLLLPALRAKFEQHDDLADLLVETHPLPIGEASKNSIWGIGLSLDDRNALHPAHWSPHGNLLGNTLVQVRHDLMRKHMDGTMPNG